MLCCVLLCFVTGGGVARKRWRSPGLRVQDTLCSGIDLAALEGDGDVLAHEGIKV